MAGKKSYIRDSATQLSKIKQRNRVAEEAQRNRTCSLFNNSYYGCVVLLCHEPMEVWRYESVMYGTNESERGIEGRRGIDDRQSTKEETMIEAYSVEARRRIEASGMAFRFHRVSHGVRLLSNGKLK
ncbi:hypothetical protein E3N88_25947 [Mikania micrantha]|uniref:Uncharacterized protein n=1 Tax=Mikania micrantha TaxID=192012 RepID=A0A5N6N8Z1_9ASTR|nr:hypothetical protein E3N88_25947 [Mikania micrantha]